MDKPPDKIYLQWEEYDGDLSHVTWRHDIIFEEDIEYTRLHWRQFKDEKPKHRERILFYTGRSLRIFKYELKNLPTNWLNWWWTEEARLGCPGQDT